MLKNFNSILLESRSKHRGNGKSGKRIISEILYRVCFDSPGESASFIKITILTLFALSLGLFASEKITGDANAILAKIQVLTDVAVKKIDVELAFTQPVDHRNPEADTFTQRVFLTHRDCTRPVVFWIEGYESRGPEEQEITKILDANQIVVEHRYYGESMPDSIDWRYLTIKQAAADHHRIVEAFKKIYAGKWVNAGISKGGQTVMYHNRFYPDDVDASVCYVAPLNFSDREPRVQTFLSSVGDETCRSRIANFQKLVLAKKNELLPFYREYADKQDYTFKIGIEKAFEYNVLEYSFAFWQWQSGGCAEIPDADAEPEDLFDHFVTVSSPFYFSDAGIKHFESFLYQALTEIGYYDYDVSPFKGLITAVKQPDYRLFLPQGIDAAFDPTVMQDVNEWIIAHGNNMIFIYGERDPWSASAVGLTGQMNALKMVCKGGNHSTRIRHFPKEDQEKIVTVLEDWLNIKIDRDYDS